MKKSILLLLIGMVAKISLSNPIIVPPVLTEVYLDGNEITIELYFQDFFWEMWDLSNLDEFELISNSSTVEFAEGIDIVFNQEMVLDNSDFVGTFTFDPNGDNIMLVGPMTYDNFTYGNQPFAEVVAPQPGQSIALLGFYDPESGYYYGAGIGIENIPTLGSNAWNVNSTGALEGWIYDINNQPIEGLQIWDVYSDETGHFLCNDLLCKIYHYISVRHNGNSLYTFQDTIYPDEISLINIYLDTTFVAIPEYFNYPNPTYGFTSFSVNIPPQQQFTAGYLSIYDMTGKQIDRIDINRRQQEITWNRTDAKPGIYIYNLVLDGKPYGSKKMIVQ